MDQAARLTGFIGPDGRNVCRVNPEEGEEYERRLREKRPDRLWWENLGDHKWLAFWIVVAVV